MAGVDAAPSGPDGPPPEPLSTEAALRELDDRAFVELVSGVWERRGWTVEAVHDPGAWYVDLSLVDEWPEERRALVRIKRPHSRKRVSGTDVRHFVRTVQGEEVDGGILVLPTAAPRSARQRAEEFNVEVVGTVELAAKVEGWDAHDLLAERVGRPLDTESTSLSSLAPAPIGSVLERFDVVASAERVLERRLPTDPTPEDVAGVTFAGVRIAVGLAAVAFVSALAAGPGSLLFSLLVGIFLLATYVGLLPLLAADIYLMRRFEATEWRPSWWSLASFALAPLPLVAGVIYWHRRRGAWS